MKRLLTVALVFAVMAEFAGLSAAQGAQKNDQKSPSTSSGTTTAPTTAPAAVEKVKTINTTRSNTFRVATQVMTGKVVSVDKVADTFTVVANGKQVTFFANKLMLPDVGKMMDIHYIQPTPGGPMEATTVQPTPGGTFAVTNLNSSRSNISVADNGSMTSKAIKEPPPEKPKQEVSISESGTMSSFRTATPEQMVTGKVVSVNPTDKTFTVETDGKKLTFSAKEMKTLPPVGQVIDIPYTQTLGGPLVATATTVHGSKSNGSSYREGVPTSASPAPTPGPVGATTIHGSKSNSSERQGAPTSTSPDLTPGPVGATTVHGSKSNGSERQGAPASASPDLTPGPVGATTVHGSKSNGTSYREGAPTSASPVPTPGPVGATTIHGSKSNSSERLAAAPSNVMTGKVLSLDKTANTFTVMSKGNKVVFTMKKGDALPEVGKIVDITYIQTTPGGPFNAITVNASKSNNL